jgi:methionyl-tRNA synthetase
MFVYAVNPPVGSLAFDIILFYYISWPVQETRQLTIPNHFYGSQWIQPSGSPFGKVMAAEVQPAFSISKIKGIK